MFEQQTDKTSQEIGVSTRNLTPCNLPLVLSTLLGQCKLHPGWKKPGHVRRMSGLIGQRLTHPTSRPEENLCAPCLCHDCPLPQCANARNLAASFLRHSVGAKDTRSITVHCSSYIFVCECAFSLDGCGREHVQDCNSICRHTLTCACQFIS